MIKISENFGQQIPCKLCGLDFDKQSHLTQCIILKLKCPELLELRTEMSTIISGLNMEETDQFLVVYEKALRMRNDILDGTQ